ncbi:MAG: carbohydrate ABC transporter permease [Clostridia bacterium]|nr:carbohydrate ABC transporter permease [Clostridia bacterium]
MIEKNALNELKKYKAKRVLAKVLTYVLLTLCAALILIPFLFAFVTSFTEPMGIFDFKWIPSPITTENYEKLFTDYNILGGLLNTLIYILPPITIGVLTSAMAAYGFARVRFPGRNLLFFSTLATVLVPGIITMIPSFVMYANIYNWVGTPLPLIVPGLFGAAMTMFFMKQYIEGIPKSLEEAAFIDGMSRGGVFFRIILPLSKTALIAQFVLSFNGAYNDYLGPLLYVGTKEELFTLQLVLQKIQTKGNTPYTLMTAGAVMALIPTLTMFIFAQRYFIEGIVMTGLKE